MNGSAPDHPVSSPAAAVATPLRSSAAPSANDDAMTTINRRSTLRRNSATPTQPNATASPAAATADQRMSTPSVVLDMIIAPIRPSDSNARGRSTSAMPSTRLTIMKSGAPPWRRMKPSSVSTSRVSPACRTTSPGFRCKRRPWREIAMTAAL